MDMIGEIQELQLEAEKEEQQINNPYYIIVGSFQVESNAINLQKYILSFDNDSKILPVVNGFHRVTIASFPNIHDAYNRMLKAFREGYDDVWIYRQK